MTAAAAAAKSLQSCPTLCNLIDGSAPGSSTHGIFQAGVLEWGAIAFSINDYCNTITNCDKHRDPRELCAVRERKDEHKKVMDQERPS